MRDTELGRQLFVGPFHNIDISTRPPPTMSSRLTFIQHQHSTAYPVTRRRLERLHAPRVPNNTSLEPLGSALTRPVTAPPYMDRATADMILAQSATPEPSREKTWKSGSLVHINFYD